MSRKFCLAAICLLLALSLMLLSGCEKSGADKGGVSDSDVVIIEFDDDDDEMEDSQQMEYSESVFYDYWNRNLISKYGTPKETTVKASGMSFSIVAGSASVLICDADGDGQDEMLHVYIGKYGKNNDSVVLEVYEFTKGKVKKSAAAVVDENCAFYGDGIASVFLSEKNGRKYICFEEFGDYLGESRLTEYLILSYDGKALKHCKSIFDPGFTSGTALYADSKGKSFQADKNGVSVFEPEYSGWETLYSEDDGGIYDSGKYVDYEKALKTELSQYGISLRFSKEGGNLGAKQNLKSITRVCKHIISYTLNDTSAKLNAVLCDYTGSLYHIGKSAVKSLKLDENRQYNLNLYLSNFSEVYLDSFYGMPESDDLIEFAIFHNIRNNSKTVDANVGNEYSYRMSSKNIANKIYKYFFVRTYESDYQEYCKEDNFMTYKKGYLYSTDVVEGAVWGDLTVVNKLESIGDSLYKVTFVNCDLDDYYAEIYPAQEIDYHITTSMLENTDISKHNKGTAIIYASDLSKRSTYRLLAYNLKDINS